MKKEVMKVRLTFTEEVLGTNPSDPEIYRNYIATKNPNQTPESTEEEVNTLPTDEENPDFYRGVTVFPRVEVDGKKVPALYGRYLYGFFKTACGAMRDQPGSLSSKFKAYKKKIDTEIKVEEKESPVILPKDYDIEDINKLPRLERPIRISGPTGERVALASSEILPVGTSVDFTITAINKELMNLIIEWLDFGEFKGIGCWRGSNKGCFTWQDITDKK